MQNKAKRRMLQVYMVTVTFLKFSSKDRWYAMTQMGRAHSWLSTVNGVDFYKLMGSGSGNGFSIWPDFSTYCLLVNWKDEESKQAFFNDHSDWQFYKDRSSKSFTLELEAMKAMGLWNGTQPFTMNAVNEEDGRIAVLTRATIKKRYIPYFWSQVPEASATVQDFEGHLFSKGVGEVPLLHQATISVWESKTAMHAYAYQSHSHVKMIQETRKKGWYSEELFAEFRVVDIQGEIW